MSSGSCPRVEEAEQPRAPVRLDPDRGEPAERRDRGRGAERPAGHAGDDEHAADHQQQRDRRAEVGLDHDQRGEEARDHADGLPELAERPRRSLAREVRGGPDEERQLRELRRLERERAGGEPAPRAVDLRRDDEHRDAEAERGQQERRGEVAQPPVVEPRRGDEQGDADQRVDALPLQERDRVALAERGRGRGGAEDHHEAERDQGEGDEDEQALLELADEEPSLFEVLYQPPEFLSAVLVVAELVVARAGRREQDDVPRLRAALAASATARSSVAEMQERHVRVAEVDGERLRRLADQVRRDDVRCSDRLRELVPALALRAAAEDQVERRVVAPSARGARRRCSSPSSR